MKKLRTNEIAMLALAVGTVGLVVALVLLTRCVLDGRC